MTVIAGPTWPGILDRDRLDRLVVEHIDHLADAARDGEWDRAIRFIDSASWLDANVFRVGDDSWFTPLHHAAWHGAPVEVVDALLARGGWRSLREATGRRPVDLARERGHLHLIQPLTPRMRLEHPAERYAAWDRHLETVVGSRIHRLGLRVRPVQTEVLAEEGVERLWFPIPGMYGGFAIAIVGDELHVDSWSRVVGGSGQKHVITERGPMLVDEGF